MEKQTPKIYKAMADIMQSISAIAKDQRNDVQKFNFRGIDDVYNALNPLLKQHRVFMTTKVIDAKREERTSKSGGTNIWTVLTIEITYFADDGSSVTSTTQGEAMDSGDKGSNKAMAAAQKYSLIQTFAIPTKEGMPETDKSNASIEDLELLKEQIVLFTDPDKLKEWANNLKEFHKNKEFITAVNVQLKKLGV